MSNFVFVLDRNKRQLDPVHPGKARRLLSTGKAAVFRRYPFAIILKQACPDLPMQDLELKLDPGSQVTGIAIVQDTKVIFGAEFEHRGSQIKDAAAVNSARWALFNALKQTGLPVATGTGGQTKFNRTRFGLPKTQWLDAASVGKVDSLKVLTTQPLLIAAKGHGNRQMCGTDKFGFPKRHRSRVQIHKGFQTGDIVTATVTKGKKIGSYVGRVLCRASGSFDIVTQSGRVSGISHRYCQPIHKRDGYAYAFPRTIGD